jgi:hypothetical protein
LVHKKPPVGIVLGCGTLSYLFTGGFFFPKGGVTYPINFSYLTLWSLSYLHSDI